MKTRELKKTNIRKVAKLYEKELKKDPQFFANGETNFNATVIYLIVKCPDSDETGVLLYWDESYRRPGVSLDAGNAYVTGINDDLYSATVKVLYGVGEWGDLVDNDKFTHIDNLLKRENVDGRYEAFKLVEGLSLKERCIFLLTGKLPDLIKELK